MRLEIAPGEQRLLSLPFHPFDERIDAVLAGQLTGAADAEEADCVLKWVADAAAWERAVKLDGTGDPRADGRWFADAAAREPSDMTLAPGEGFFVWNRQTASETVALMGEVVLDASSSVALPPLLSLFGYPYSTAMPVEQTVLWREWLREGQADAGESDEIVDPSVDAAPLDAFRPGKGYWYKRNAESALLWTEPRPYENLFPTNNEPPSVVGMSLSPAGERLTLRIACRGVPGETLDVFCQDLTPTQQLDTGAGWTLAAEAVPTAGRAEIEWADAGSPDRPPINETFCRLYLVGRADVDADGNGIPDARETFLGWAGIPRPPAGAAPGGEQTEETHFGPGGADFEAEGTNDVVESSGHAAGGIVYVDAKTGRDAFSGRRAVAMAGDGPKRTIRAGLGTAASGDLLVIREGAYREDLNLCGRDLAVRIDGRVDLSGPTLAPVETPGVPTGTNVATAIAGEIGRIQD